VADAKLALSALIEWVDPQRARTSDAYRREVTLQIRSWKEQLTDDLLERPGESMSQGQLLQTLNRTTGPGDVIVAAAGSPPGDILKVWDCSNGSRVHIEFGFSCMGHEIPAALGIRLAEPDGGEVIAVVGDGGYLMSPSELVTAVQLGLKITVVLVVNGGYQSIHGLQEATTGGSFGNEFRSPEGEGVLSGAIVDVDYAASARAFGCEVFEADSTDTLRRALSDARDSTRPAVVVVQVEPRRGLLASGAFWDLGLAQASDDERMQQLAAEHAKAVAALQRHHL
jgi:3D-(3,5/4)-trihydroxycyclohexane-1,2-dione acylhydrolase (decyclizing)